MLQPLLKVALGYGLHAKQHPMIIALAAIGGTYAFGPLGILFGPVVVSLVAAVLKEIQACMKSGAAFLVVFCVLPATPAGALLTS